jgi:hypothetical protein
MCQNFKKLPKNLEPKKPLWEGFGKLKKTFGPKKPNVPLQPNGKVSLCSKCKFLKMLKKVYKTSTWSLKKKGKWK